MLAARRWQDWTTTLIGAVVALSPLAFTTTWIEPAAGAAYIFGGLIFVVGVLKLLLPEASYFDSAQLVLAIVLFFSPWAIGFTAMTGMAWMAWIAGVAMALVVATLFTERGQKLAPTA